MFHAFIMGIGSFYHTWRMEKKKLSDFVDQLLLEHGLLTKQPKKTTLSPQTFRELIEAATPKLQLIDAKFTILEIVDEIRSRGYEPGEPEEQEEGKEREVPMTLYLIVGSGLVAGYLWKRRRP